MGRLVREMDWSQTPLGPRERWPHALQVALEICLRSHFPMSIWWGLERVSLYNDAYISILGKRHPRALGSPAAEAGGEAWEFARAHAEAVIDRGESPLSERVRLEVERDGVPEEAYFIWSITPLPDDRGGTGGALATLIEETARIRTEVALRESQRRSSSGLMAAEVGTFEWELATNQLWGDENYARLLGLPTETANGSPLEAHLAAVHPDDRERVTDLIRSSIATGTAYEAEYQVASEGHPHWIVARGRVERDAAGRTTRFPGVVLDVTERRLAQEALRMSESRYRALFDSIDEGFCIIEMRFDETGRAIDFAFLEVNPALEKHTGLRNATGRSARALLPELEEHWFDTYGRVARTGESVRFISGSESMGRWFNVFAFRVDDPAHHRLAVLFTDVSESRRAEEALRGSREQLQSVLENSLGAAYRRNLRTDSYDYLSPGIERVLGIDFEAMQGLSLDDFLERIHPDDLESVRNAIADGYATGGGRIEYRIRRGAEYAWVADEFTVQADEAGEAAFRTGTVRDVTDRKAAEDALRWAAASDAFRLALDEGLRALVDPGEIQAEAARILGRKLRASRVHYGEITDDGEHNVIRSDYTDGVPSVVGRHRFDDFGPGVMREFRAHRTLVVDDVASDVRLTPAEREATAALMIGAYVLVPLIKNDRPVATLVVHQSKARRWTPEEVQLIEETAERTWDAVERGRAQEALRESEERLRLTIDAAELGIWEHDLFTGQVRLDSRAQEQYALDPLVSADEVTQRLHPRDRKRFAREIAFALDATRRAQLASEYRVIHPNGSTLWLRVQGRVEFEHSGPDARPRRSLGTVQDITQWREAQEERERLLLDSQTARNEAEDANRAKADFLAAMSHELRTPLNAIGGYVDLLDLGIHGPVTDAQKSALSRIGANQRHLLALINDILQFAKLEAGQLQFSLNDLSAPELLDKVEPLVAPFAATRGVAYSVEDCDSSVRLIGDEERVLQIMLNLVTNAIKFTQPGGWAVLSCDPDGEWVNIRVRDNGPGIHPDKHQLIFDPFVQADRRLNSPHDGVGLGLAISRDLARAMGGDLEVSALPGAGSTFTLRLPRAADLPKTGTPA